MLFSSIGAFLINDVRVLMGVVSLIVAFIFITERNFEGK